MPMIKARYTKPQNERSETGHRDSAVSCGRKLRKSPGITVVLVESAKPDDLIVAGSSVADQKIGTLYVEVSMTERTNIKDETTEWVRRVYDEMNALIGPVHEARYLLAHAVDGDAYGYGGLTQNLQLARTHG